MRYTYVVAGVRQIIYTVKYYYRILRLFRFQFYKIVKEICDRFILKIKTLDLSCHNTTRMVCVIFAIYVSKFH